MLAQIVCIHHPRTLAYAFTLFSKLKLERELDRARATDLVLGVEAAALAAPPSQLFSVCVEWLNCGEVMQLMGAPKLGWSAAKSAR